MNTTIEMVLRDARNRIAKPEQWVQGSAALDAEGVQVTPDDATAVCFCLSGSVRAATNRLVSPTVVEGTPDRETVLRETGYVIVRAIHRHDSRFVRSTPIVSMTLWNDSVERTHDEILRVLDDGIAEVSSRPE